MISIPNSTPPLFLNRINPNSLLHFTSPPSFIFFNKSSSKYLIRALKTESDGDKVIKQDPFGPDLLKKPRISSLDVGESATTTKNERFSDESEDNKRGGEDDDWVDWEDQILEDTVPLVGFVRMLLHSGKFGGHFYAKFSSGPNHCIHGHALRDGSGYRHGYLFNVNISSTRKCAIIMYGGGDRLSPDHEKTILERLLPYHPDFERKIGCGVDYIKVDYHPDFADSRCLFIVRKDGESVDFSYWKCIKGLIKKNYPLYADSFILRHFRRRSSRNE